MPKGDALENIRYALISPVILIERNGAKLAGPVERLTRQYGGKI